MTFKFKKILERNLTGLEEYENINKAVDELMKEVLSALKDTEPAKRMIMIDRVFGHSAMINFDRV